MNKVSCPICSKPVSTNPFKSWKFGKFDVGRYQCPNCKSKFNFSIFAQSSFEKTSDKSVLCGNNSIHGSVEILVATSVLSAGDVFFFFSSQLSRESRTKKIRGVSSVPTKLAFLYFSIIGSLLFAFLPSLIVQRTSYLVSLSKLEKICAS